MKAARASIEQQALDEIENLADRIDLTVASVSDVFISIMSEAFEHIYEGQRVFGRISMIETAITKTGTGQEKLSEDDSIVSKGVIESFLRTIASSQHLKRLVVGQSTSQGAGIDYQIIGTRREVNIEDVMSEHLMLDDTFVKESRLGVPRDIPLRFLGVPMLSIEGKAYGAFDLIMAGATAYGEADIFFVQRAISLLSTILGTIDNRVKSIEIAKSAKSYMAVRCEANVSIFLVEAKRNKSLDIYQIEDIRPSSSSEQDMRTLAFTIATY
eukprot:jgi/Hompol1/6608/HPOL_000605-RA